MGFGKSGAVELLPGVMAVVVVLDLDLERALRVGGREDSSWGRTKAVVSWRWRMVRRVVRRGRRILS